VDQVVDLDRAVVLDVGAGPGWFRSAFERRGATYWGLESDVGELSGTGLAAAAVLGSGLRLPFRDEALDVVFSSNVLEHVPDPERFADELVRVTRPGGTVVLCFTPWLSPWGGHETSPWHYLGGDRAARRYQHRHGVGPTPRYGSSRFAVSVRRMLRWAGAQQQAELRQVFPRYHPRWARWVTRVPVVRELVSWNVVLVLHRS
jgi:SAM-dependent methyltransferase